MSILYTTYIGRLQQQGLSEKVLLEVILKSIMATWVSDLGCYSENT